MPATLLAINYGLNQDFGYVSGSLTLPTTYYIGLSTTSLSNTDTSGSAPTEPATAAGYSRVSYTNNKSNWSTASSGSISNLTSVSFPQSTTAWGNIASIFLASSENRGTGDVWYYYNLNPVIPVMGATILTFGVGAITVDRE